MLTLLRIDVPCMLYSADYPPLPTHCHPLLRLFTTLMLQPDADKRPSTLQLTRHKHVQSTYESRLRHIQPPTSGTAGVPGHVLGASTGAPSQHQVLGPAAVAVAAAGAVGPPPSLRQPHEARVIPGISAPVKVVVTTNAPPVPMGGLGATTAAMPSGISAGMGMGMAMTPPPPVPPPAGSMSMPWPPSMGQGHSHSFHHPKQAFTHRPGIPVPVQGGPGNATFPVADVATGSNPNLLTVPPIMTGQPRDTDSRDSSNHPTDQTRFIVGRSSGQHRPSSNSTFAVSNRQMVATPPLAMPVRFDPHTGLEASIGSGVGPGVGGSSSTHSSHHTLDSEVMGMNRLRLNSTASMHSAQSREGPVSETQRPGTPHDPKAQVHSLSNGSFSYSDQASPTQGSGHEDGLSHNGSPTRSVSRTDSTSHIRSSALSCPVWSDGRVSKSGSSPVNISMTSLQGGGRDSTAPPSTEYSPGLQLPDGMIDVSQSRRSSQSLGSASQRHPPSSGVPHFQSSIQSTCSIRDEDAHVRSLVQLMLQVTVAHRRQASDAALRSATEAAGGMSEVNRVLPVADIACMSQFLQHLAESMPDGAVISASASLTSTVSSRPPLYGSTHPTSPRRNVIRQLCDAAVANQQTSGHGPGLPASLSTVEAQHWMLEQVRRRHSTPSSADPQTQDVRQDRTCPPPSSSIRSECHADSTCGGTTPGTYSADTAAHGEDHSMGMAALRRQVLCHIGEIGAYVDQARYVTVDSMLKTPHTWPPVPPG